MFMYSRYVAEAEPAALHVAISPQQKTGTRVISREKRDTSNKPGSPLWSSGSSSRLKFCTMLMSPRQRVRGETQSATSSV